jgi:hypothetical protein
MRAPVACEFRLVLSKCFVAFFYVRVPVARYPLMDTLGLRLLARQSGLLIGERLVQAGDFCRIFVR